MFTSEQLAAELPLLIASALPRLESVEFNYDDFRTPSSEQAIWAFRGSKRGFPTGLRFFVKTLLAQDWLGSNQVVDAYGRTALCKSISEAEFIALVTRYSSQLVPSLPPFLREFIGFQWGMMMYADWNDVGAVAELADSFVAFYWSTSA